MEEKNGLALSAPLDGCLVVVALVAKGIPAVFLTAHGAGVDLPESLAHLQVLAKRFSAELPEQALRKALGGISERSGGR